MFVCCLVGFLEEYVFKVEIDKMFKNKMWENCIMDIGVCNL